MRYVLNTADFIGSFVLYIYRIFSFIVSFRLSSSLTLKQFEFLGTNSIPLAVLVLSFVGATVSYLLAEELGKRGAGAYVGGFLLVGLLRELLPILTGIVLAGKAGAAITSEIGTMKITSQIEAMESLSTDPHWFLTAPRVVALTLASTIVGVFAGFAGFYSGYLMAYQKLGISFATFTAHLDRFVSARDFFACLVKLVLFGLVVAFVGCYLGYKVEGGASGVGKAVTYSVVLSIALIFALDLLLLPVLF